MKIQSIQNYNSTNKNDQSKSNYLSTYINNSLTNGDSFKKNFKNKFSFNLPYAKAPLFAGLFDFKKSLILFSRTRKRIL